MISGAKCTNDDIIYTVFKKHFCPTCGTRLKRVKTTKIVNAKSFEAKNYDIDPYTIGDVKVSLVEFYCPNCDKQISIEDMKKIEGKVEGKYVITADDETVEEIEENLV
ncbi:MAG: hypothetical protein J6B29_03175 [Clostridia bacterium]|nr:hypothetical protein [Clostridia bacterium]